ncbi:hypothetical protein Tco_0270641 [Tanacetum coccineum]
MPSVVRVWLKNEGQAGTRPCKLDEGHSLQTLMMLLESQLYQLLHNPEVQENLKLTLMNRMIPEEPVSSTRDLKTATRAESMVSVTIQQDTSVIPPMTSPVIGPVPRPASPNVHWPLPTTTTTTSATTTTTLPLPPQPQQGPSDPIIIKRMGELEELIANLVEENQALEERLDKQGSRINKLETMDLPKMIREQTVEFIDSQEIDRKINESVKEVVISSVKHAMRAPLRARFKDLPTSDMKEILLQRMLEENYDKGHAVHREETKKKSKQDSPKTLPGSPPSSPPPPPPPSGASGASSTTGTSDSAQAPPTPPPSLSTHQGDEQAYSIGEEVGRDHIPTVNLRQSWWKPLTEDRHPSPELAWTIPSSDLLVPTNNWASALKTTYVPTPENSLLAQTGDIATFMDCFISHFPYGRKPQASHTDKVDVAILQYQRFSSEGDRRAVRTHKRILSVVRIEIFSMYGYGVQMILRSNEIHKFSDGTLQQIDEALDYRVKEFRVNRTNPGMNTRFLPEERNVSEARS